jgi:hypothetical protein
MTSSGHNPTTKRIGESMSLPLRRRFEANEVALAAAYAEIDRLRAENQRLAAERLRSGGLENAVERADRVAEVAGEIAEADDEAWHKGVEALVLREMLIDVCLSVERSMAAVRAQLSEGVPPPEVDRRRMRRRASDREASDAAAAHDEGAGATNGASGHRNGKNRTREGNGR